MIYKLEIFKGLYSLSLLIRTHLNVKTSTNYSFTKLIICLTLKHSDFKKPE